jgi:hypothetical protein
VAWLVLILAGQLGIDQTLASNHQHEQRVTICIGKFVVFRRTVVKTEHLLVNVVVKVKWLNRNIGTAKRRTDLQTTTSCRAPD